jgi:tRNA-uridine 2-sulfurtransferase
VNTPWISGETPIVSNGGGGIADYGYGGKTRYRQPDAACTYAREANGEVLHFYDGQWAPTPGQYAVLYRNNVCLGGGVIA